MGQSEELSAWGFIASPRRHLDSAKRRRQIFLQVFAAHALIIFVPFILALVEEYLHPQETEFRIELINPPSTGEEVGIPERTPPAESDVSEPSEPPAEPEVDLPSPEPVPEAPPAEPVVDSLPDPDLPPPPEPRVRLPKVPARRVSIREPSVKLPRVVRKTNSSSTRKTEKKSASNNSRGGWNKNALVPIGTRDLAQMQGKNSGTAPGGMGKNDPSYPGKVAEFLKQLWQTPSGIFLNGRNADVLIRLRISGNGVLTRKEVLRYSGISAMDDSVRALLRRIERVPAPADGKAISLEIILRPENLNMVF